MSDAGVISSQAVALHVHEAHSAVEARIAELIGVTEEACREAASLRAELESHLTTYHAPEPEAEPEAEVEAVPDRVEEAIEEEAEAVPDVPPMNSHPFFRPLGRRE